MAKPAASWRSTHEITQKQTLLKEILVYEAYDVELPRNSRAQSCMHKMVDSDDCFH